MKDNKLLAEYLGWEIYDPLIGKLHRRLKHTMVSTPFGQYDIKDVEFHSSWDWLMMVVDKIEEDGLTWRMEHRRKYAQNRDVYSFAIWEDEDDNPVVNEHEFKKIEAVYNTCVEYVRAKAKWLFKSFKSQIKVINR